TCPQSANVIPDYDTNLNGTDLFTVCTSKQNNYDLLIHGTTESSPTICIYPATYADATHIYYKPDVQTGGPLVTCVAAQSGGDKVSFNGINYNYVFIVEQPYEDQMTTCLTTMSYEQCPHFSAGQIR